MNRIKFEEYSLNWYRIASLVIAVIFIVLGSSLIFNFQSTTLIILGIVVILFEASRFFWYRNYVKWNKVGIYIRLNSFLGNSFKFGNITKVKVTSKELILTSEGTEHSIDLNKIDRNDIDDLADILVKKSNAEYISEVMHDSFYK